MFLAPIVDCKLSDQEVHIWRVNLDSKQAEVEELKLLLSPPEIERSDRYSFPIDRDHFIICRATLRKVLSSYVGIGPEQLQFIYSERGKPSLVNNHGIPIEFNISHSNGLALYAISLKRSVGIDVEYVRPIYDLLELTKRFFTVTEYNSIKSLPSHQQQLAFFQLWTCKESYLKATGVGLIGLKKVEIDIADPHIPKLSGINNWQLKPLQLEGKYVGAIVVEGELANLKYLQ